MVNRLTAPFYIKKNLKGLDNIQKFLALIYFPTICLMWYGYYMWKDTTQNMKKVKSE